MCPNGFSDFVVDTWRDTGAALFNLPESTLGWLHSIGKEVGDIPGEVAQFVDNPRGYIEAALKEIVVNFDPTRVDGLVNAATVGLGGLARDALASVGLRPLIDGVVAAAGGIRSLVRDILAWAECLDPMSQQIFWVIAGAIVGARASGLVRSKNDLDHALAVDRLGELTQFVEVARSAGKLLECAIRLAFEIPLPETRATERGPAVPAGTPPMGCVMATLLYDPNALHQMAGFRWTEADTIKHIDELWPHGWRIKHLQPYLIGAEVFYDWVLRQGGGDQLWTRGAWTPERLESEFERIRLSGYRFVELGSYVSLFGPMVSAVLERLENPPDQQLVLGQQARWWMTGDKGDNPWFSDPKGQHQQDWVRFASAYVVGSEPDTDVRFNVILQRPRAGLRAVVPHTSLGFNHGPASLAQRDARASAANMRLLFASPYVVDGRLHIAAKWEERSSIPEFPRRLRLPGEPSARLTLWGWRTEDFYTQWQHLSAAGYRIATLGSYVA